MTKPIYFSGLNGIRALCAIGVIVSHCFQAFHNFGLPKAETLQFASLGVTVFFTLSGFLITYLLLSEKEATETVSLRKFYLRRVFRIWPLYFFYIAATILVTIFVFGEDVNLSVLWLYIFFLPNIAFNLNIYPEGMAHLWSIGIEEQFYAFWPLVVKKINKLLRFLVFLSLAVILLRIAAKFADVYLNQHFFFSFLSCTRFDCMAVGGIASVLFHSSNEKFLRIAKSRIVEFSFWIFVILAVLNRFTFFSVFTDTVVSILAALFIVYQITSDRVVISLENPLFKHLGIVSFGLYVYHPLVISLLAFAYSSMGFKTTLHPALLIVIIVGATYFISLLSYKFLELPFLRSKNKFVVVESTNK